MDISPRQDSNNNVIPSIPSIVIFFAVCVVGAILTALTSPLIVPAVASIQAQRTDTLQAVLLLIGGFVFFLVQGLLVVAIVRFRARANDISDGVPLHGNSTLEIVWTIIPAVIVAVLSFYSWQVWTDNTAPRDAENFVNGQPVQVQAYGARYAWAFEYRTNDMVTAEDGTQSPAVLKSDLLHIYIGQHVKVDMEARDVIHSFWVPAFRVKQDLLPGRITEVRFDPIGTTAGFPYRLDENGVLQTLTAEQAQLTAADARTAGVGDRLTIYPLRCTELCGSGHGNMITSVYVYEDEVSYLNNFYDPTLDRIINPPDDPILQGQEVLTSGAYPCASCHVLTSLNWVGVTGPSLEGIGNRAARREGGLSAIEYLVKSLHLPHSYLVPGYGAQMPYFGESPEAPEGQAPYNYMPDADLTAIVSFLCTQTESGDPSETSCNFAVNPDGTSVDADLTRTAIQEIADTYDALYE